MAKIAESGVTHTPGEEPEGYEAPTVVITTVEPAAQIEATTKPVTELEAVAPGVAEARSDVVRPDEPAATAPADRVDGAEDENASRSGGGFRAKRKEGIG